MQRSGTVLLVVVLAAVAAMAAMAAMALGAGPAAAAGSGHRLIASHGAPPAVDSAHAAGTAASDGALAMAAETVGSETCLTCHDDLEGWAAWSPHASEAFYDRSELGCETCHGPGAMHVEDPEDPAHQLRIDRWTSIRSADMCLSCHGGAHPGFGTTSEFRTTSHALAGLACNDCHSIHDRDGWAPDGDDEAPFAAARIVGVSAMCVTCHRDVEAEFHQPQAHPLEGGTLGCTSCHDPHVAASRMRLAAFGNRECASCHVDKSGPFVFEHGSVIVEGCAACHTPHGSNNRHLLLFQQTGQLCYSCHIEVPAFHFGFNPAAPPSFGQNTNCTACHSSIHGSNFDPFFLK